MFPARALSPLAIDGAAPLRPHPFPAWPHFEDDEIAAAAEVMRSGRVNYWTGEHGREFERDFAASCGCQYAVAVANGTVALELALRALGIGPDDDVIIPSRTFVATASCVRMCGARPIFTDVDRYTQNISVDSIQMALTPRTRAIIAVHLGGWPCAIDPILELAHKHGLFVIEDCAQAQGATIGGRRVGSFGDVATFSFCQDKIITTLGEGGMLTTNDPELWQRAYSFRDNGRSAAEPESREEKNHGFRWVHDSIGTNWRMTEIQSAVGRLQLRKAAAWLERRRAFAQTLALRLARIPALRVPFPAPEIQPAWYRFYAFVRPKKLARGWNRDLILQAINAEGVQCFVGSCSEVYLEKAFADVQPSDRHPVAQELGETSLAFLVHPTLTDADIEDTCQAVEKVMAVAGLAS